MIPKQMTPCHSREAVVTVLSYCNGRMNGYLQHPRLDKTEELQSLSQMVLLLGSLLELEDCPKRPMPLFHRWITPRAAQPFFVYRFFSGNIIPGKVRSSGRKKTMRPYFTAE